MLLCIYRALTIFREAKINKLGLKRNIHEQKSEGNEIYSNFLKNWVNYLNSFLKISDKSNDQEKYWKFAK